MTVAAILVIATVIVINWDKVEAIFKSIVNMFVSAAGKTATAVSNVFDSIYNKAMDSVRLFSRIIDGIKEDFRELDRKLAIDLSKNMKSGEYLLVTVIRSGTPIPVSYKRYDKKYIMNKYKQGYSSYTLNSGHAESAMKGAFPNAIIKRHDKWSSEALGFQFDHYHAFINGIKIPKVHSLYGTPIWNG